MRTGKLLLVPLFLLTATLLPVGMSSAAAQDGSTGLLAVAPPSGALSSSPALSAVAPTPAEQALMDLTNADRASNGLPALQFDPALLAIARDRAAEQNGLADLSHTDAQGNLVFAQMVNSEGLDYTLIGENLARVPGVDASVAGRAETALMNSPAHRANVLEPSFDEFAIGSVVDASGRTVYAEIYRAA